MVLDPASNEVANETIGAAEIFQRDGLQQPWHGRVFLNPPYGTEAGESRAGKFCNKAIAEYQAGRVSEAIILVNSSHSQNWQRPLYDFAVCLVDHRIKFLSPDGKENPNPTFQNIFIYCGPNKKAFAAAFGIFGYVMEKISIAGSRNGEADIPAVLDRRDNAKAVSGAEGRSK